MTESSEVEEIKEEAPAAEPKKKTRRRSLSMFFPVLLIALGTILLFAALDLITTVNWEAALRLWPLLLIFIGLDLIVRVVPSPGGTILSLIVGLVAAGIIIYVLLFTDEVTFLAETVGQSSSGVTSEAISYTAAGADEADISLDLGSQGASVNTLSDSQNLIEAELSYTGELIFDASTDNGLAVVNLGASSTQDWTYWINPLNWLNQDGDQDRWTIALSPNVSSNLNVDIGSGSVDLSLEDLALTALDVAGGSGRVEIVPPDGDYDLTYDGGSGSASITLPQAGRQKFLVEGGSGRLVFLVPESANVMVVLEDKGSGSFAINESRFIQSEVGENGEGVWITEGYENSSNQVELTLDTGSGSVTFKDAGE